MMKAEDIMTTEVVTIRGSATVAEAVDLMKYKGLRSLIVEPRTENDPYGMVSETDIVYKVAAYGKDSKQVRVYEIMTKPCIVVTGVRRAPVIKGKLLGIISITDILRKSDLFENPKRIFIEDEIEVAREEARKICTTKGDSSRECAAAWDIVEELLAVASDQRLVKENVVE
ncbi:CBS domain-containing protein [Cuspidothrix issatschenkoi]|uniref:CBS domain-containing protein n=1 Tax=Cuspidothrix issatschenkoi CHARLIE-1 TaxID=2052836 RepID=A0A2S6CT79_9CYAN|nr:CBS domain-containing protein [Cuspidothrix issatschenkoi]PPJ62891.1 hypothetical protein CUN59_13065 [Cuspidothrix issatschenkoi CHARLIE-1]